MATLDFAHREITARVVYFGATGSGTNTNLRQLHKLVHATGRGQLHKFGPRDITERSYTFDYVAEGLDINGFAVRFCVYSLPGGLALPAHREEIMREMDAIVFVADARPTRGTDNLDALLELERLLSLQGLELATVPVVIQVNHTDGDGARRPNDVTFDLNPYGFTVVPAVAMAGQGVLETHGALTGAVAARIRDKLSGDEAAITLTAVHRASRWTDEDMIRAHLDAIQAKTASTPEAVLLDDATGSREVERHPEIRVPLAAREFLGSQPVELLAGRVTDDRIVLDVVMQRRSDGERRQISVVLEHRQADPTPAPRHTPPISAPTRDRVADYLPERFEMTEQPRDLPPVLYGLVGLVGGVLIGLLAGYLVGAMF